MVCWRCLRAARGYAHTIVDLMQVADALTLVPGGVLVARRGPHILVAPRGDGFVCIRIEVFI